MKTIDVVIIGGSLAGAACARELTRRGIEAVAFEREHFPREKVCGGFLSPGAVDLLSELDLRESLLAIGATTVRSARVRLGKLDVRFDLPRCGMGISRRALDAMVANHPAVRKGAVRKVERVGERFRAHVDDAEVSARVVVDAAGKLSRFTPRRSGTQFGVQFYSPESCGDMLDFCFFEGGYGGSVTVEGGRSNACFLVEKSVLGSAIAPPGQEGWLRDQAKIAKLPYFAQTGWLIKRMASFDPPPRRFAPPLLSRRGDRSLLDGPLVTGPIADDRGPADFIAIGDAAGMVDPFCGEGMRHALDTGMRAARVIANSLSHGDKYDVMLQRYERESDLHWKGKRRFGRFIREMLRYPRLTAAGFRLNPGYWLRKLWN